MKRELLHAYFYLQRAVQSRVPLINLCSLLYFLRRYYVLYGDIIFDIAILNLLSRDYLRHNRKLDPLIIEAVR
jgi:hypothetical protein